MVGATGLLLPEVQAQSPDALVCVSGDIPDPPTQCDGITCEATVPSYLSALELIRERAELLPAASYLKVCSVEGAGTAHYEDIQLNSSGGLLGGVFELDFGGTTLCPSSAGNFGSTLTWRTDQADVLRNLVIDYSDSGPCPDLQRTGLQVFGGGSLRLDDVHFTETKSATVTIGPDGPATQVHWRSGSSSRNVGAVVDTWGLLRLGRVMISGGRVGGAWGGKALLQTNGTNGQIELQDTIFYGNATDSTGEEGASLIHGHVLKAQRVTFFENAAFGHDSSEPMPPGPLLKIGFTDPGLELGDFGTLLGKGAIFSDLVFVRNRSLVLPVDGPPDGPAAPQLPSLDTEACAGEVIGDALRDRTSPWDGLTERAGSLIEVLPTLGHSGEAEFILARSTFVENAVGGGGLIDVFSSGANLQLQLIQNTFAENGPGPIMDIPTVSNSDTQTDLVVLRNLFLRNVSARSGLPDSTLWLISGGSPAPLDHVTISMNVHNENAPLYVIQFLPDQAMLGPNLTYDSIELAPNPAFRVQSPCERFKRVCPGVTDATCAEWTSSGQAYACAEGTGGDYLLAPDRQFALDGGRSWPWDTAFFEVPGFPGWQELGAAGWTCLADRGGVDAHYDSNKALAWGDADGQVDAIDCDNDDSSIQAYWPDLDGYGGTECNAPEDSCFICPELAEDPTPKPDPKEEPDPEPTPDPGPESDPAAVTEGCSHQSGWGLAWSCDETGGLSLALLGLLSLLAPARRREPRRRS